MQRAEQVDSPLHQSICVYNQQLIFLLFPWILKPLMNLEFLSTFFSTFCGFIWEAQIVYNPSVSLGHELQSHSLELFDKQSEL